MTSIHYVTVTPHATCSSQESTVRIPLPCPPWLTPEPSKDATAWKPEIKWNHLRHQDALCLLTDEPQTAREIGDRANMDGQALGIRCSELARNTSLVAQIKQPHDNGVRAYYRLTKAGKRERDHWLDEVAKRRKVTRETLARMA